MFFKTRIASLTASLAAMTLERDSALARIAAAGGDPAQGNATVVALFASCMKAAFKALGADPVAAMSSTDQAPTTLAGIIAKSARPFFAALGADPVTALASASDDCPEAADFCASLGTDLSEAFSASHTLAEGHAGTITALELEVTALKSKMTSVQIEGARQALDIAASVSVPPVGADPGPGAPQGNSDADIFARYKAIEDRDERFKFYQANRASINRASNG